MALFDAYPGKAYPGATYPSYTAPSTPAPTATLTIGGTPVDVTARIRLDQGVSITRGRQDQLQNLSAGTCTFTLDNTDGALDPNITSAVRYPIQVSTDKGGVRFTGRVDIWQRQWPNGGQEQQTVQVTCTDLWSDMERLGAESLSWLTINAYQPTAFYPLTENQSSDPRAFDASGNRSPDLVPWPLGNGGSLSWGQGTQAPLDSSGMLKLTPASATVGWYLRSEQPIQLPIPSGGSNAPFTIHCTVNTTQADSGVMVALSSASGATMASSQSSGEWIVSLPTPGHSGDIGYWSPDLSLNMTSGFANVGVSPNQGTTVSVTFSHNGNGTAKIWVQEHSQTLTISPPLLHDLFYLSVGGLREIASDLNGIAGNTALLNGSIGNVAVWDRVLSDTEVQHIVKAEQYGITDDPQTAIQRWLGWITNTSPEAGALSQPPTQLDPSATSGAIWKTTQTGSIATLLREAEQTEGGLSFVDRNGTVQFISRHTPRSLPSLTVDAELVNPDAAITTDWRQAIESATASSTSGDNYAYNIGTGTGTNTSIVSLSTDSAEVRRATQAAVNGGQLTTKLPTLTLDLGTLDDTTQQAAAALDIGSELIIQRLPSRPSSDPYMVQGYQEQISHIDWTITYNVTSTGIGSGYDVWTLDDTTSGVLDDGHRLDW